MASNESIHPVNQPSIYEKKILNTVEAATLLGIAKSTLYKMTMAGMIPHSRPRGYYLYFLREELEQWMLSGRKKTRKEMEEAAATYITTKDLK